MKEYIERELLLIGVDGCISALHVQAKGDLVQGGNQGLYSIAFCRRRGGGDIL